MKIIPIFDHCVRSKIARIYFCNNPDKKFSTSNHNDQGPDFQNHNDSGPDIQNYNDQGPDIQNHNDLGPDIQGFAVTHKTHFFLG